MSLGVLFLCSLAQFITFNLKPMIYKCPNQTIWYHIPEDSNLQKPNMSNKGLLGRPRTGWKDQMRKDVQTE
jgi:hypothetical protein